MTKQNPNRRYVVAAIAALPALAATGVSAQEATDPVIAAIDAHKSAVADHAGAVDAVAELERTLPPETRQWVPGEGEREAPAGNADDSRWIDAQLAVLSTSDAVDTASWALIDDAAPTTVAGAAALLSYAHDFVAAGSRWPSYAGEDSGETEDWNSEMHRKLAVTLGRPAAGDITT
jgi:hypothetical protein